MSTPDIAPEPDATPDEPVEEQTLEDAIAEQLASDGEGDVPAADPDPSDNTPDETPADPDPPAPAAAAVDPFAPPVSAEQPDTINAWGLELTQDEFQTLLGAYQFAASLTAEQIAQLQAAGIDPGSAPAGGATPPPVGGVPVGAISPDDWEDVDPAIRSTLEQQQAELAAMRAQFEQAQQAQAAAQYRDLVQSQIDQFGQAHQLGEDDTKRIVTRLRDSGLLPAFVERAGGDVARAVEQGLYTAMATDPVYQARLAQQAAAQDARIAEKKAKAGGVSGSSGSSVSPLGTAGAPQGRQPEPPRTATEARARRAAEAQQGLAEELRAALSGM